MRTVLVLLALAAAPTALGQGQDPRRTPVVLAVERAAPAVVSITTVTPVNDPFAAFWGGPRSNTGEGSGVVIDSTGIVLTNAHVVEGAHQIRATFADGRAFDAVTLGLAPELDLAVLRLDGASGLVAVEIGTSEGLMLGEPTIAIGNPLGLGHTVTTGVVSAVHRELQTERRVYQDFIQTDASINPGNSGGPLLDARGRMIGINTAVRRDGQNIGFAIPVDRAMKVASDLLAFGRVQVPWLGFDLADVSLRTGGGAAQVVRVWPGSPAARAGLLPGDLVNEVDGRAVQGRGDLNTYLAGRSSGATVRLGWLREGKPMRAAAAGADLPDDLVDVVLTEILGIELSTGPVAGLRAVRPGGAFARAGLLPGDVIVAVNGERTASPADLRGALAHAKSEHRDTALFTVQRGRDAGRFHFRI